MKQVYEDDDFDDIDEIEEELEDLEEPDTDLLTVHYKKREAQLDEGVYTAIVGEVIATRVEGPYGKYIRVMIPFRVTNPDTGKAVTARFVGNRSLDPAGRLYQIIKGILGTPPPDYFDLREITGKKVKVTIEHRIDDRGNVWENVTGARKIRKKKKAVD